MFSKENKMLDASEGLNSFEELSPKILILFGTRPEAIKLAPVILELKRNSGLDTCVVSSSQHAALLAPFLKIFDFEVDYDLRIATENQSLSQIGAKILSSFDEILERENPDLVLVQGDTTTAFAGALAAFNRQIRIGHIEAGLRSGNAASPFPEEMNRRLISQMATFHFAATEKNRQNLLQESINSGNIFLTGNTVVDALQFILTNSNPSRKIRNLIEKTAQLKRVILTTHRRESFGDAMRENLLELRRFVENHDDLCLIFPVHPNPNVRQIANTVLAEQKRVFLLEPLDYIDFIALMKHAWLIISDSGGVQEEAPSLGKPLLILRENTERPEAIESGVAKLVGGDSKVLAEMLEKNYEDKTWMNSVKQIQNPFGDGRSAKKIAEILREKLHVKNKDQKVKSQIANLK